MFDLGFDSCDDTGQSTQRGGETVSPQRAPDFEAIQQPLRVNRDHMTIVEIASPSKHAFRQNL